MFTSATRDADPVVAAAVVVAAVVTAPTPATAQSMARPRNFLNT